MTSINHHRFCLAPMMEWSDRHCRYFWRLMSKHSLLYTEMVTTGALIHGDRERFLQYNAEEQPLAIQLGGSSASDLAECARIAEDHGFCEVNLNCGCPSDRVQNGKIGAILMSEPELVAECVAQMKQACDIPVTVKHRLGIDELDNDEHLHRFVRLSAEAGCETFIVHARKAWLKGLSPKENREVPPLQYERVYRLKQEFPQLKIILNGGINSTELALESLKHIDGVMVGREAYNNPYILSEVDRMFFEDHAPTQTRDEILERFAEYCAQNIAKGTRLHHMTRHIYGLYSSQPGARLFRRHMSQFSLKPDADEKVLYNARQAMNARSNFDQK